MSNQAVGSVYQSIIDEVINSSRVDFEENGVEEAVLEELRKGWQQKLSQLDVARFPWDPKPDVPPVQQATPAQTAQTAQPSGSTLTQAQFAPQLPLPNSSNAAAPNQNGTQIDGSYIKQEPGVAIKQEPGTQQAGMPPYQAYNGVDNTTSVAASRAAQQLQAQYGNRAAGSINAIQDRMSQHQQPQSQQQTTHLSNNQTDGAGDQEDDDYEGILLERSAAGTLHELGRVEIDRILHAKIAAQSKSMEGGGLMLPLKEATSQQVTTGLRSRKVRGVGAYDGGDEDPDDIDDEDAINSDLDDPDEDQEDDEADEELGHIMLCMYDKVQRVKNKWKCTLKDGVLTVNGKEYVFHKATGEYEW